MRSGLLFQTPRDAYGGSNDSQDGQQQQQQQQQQASWRRTPGGASVLPHTAAAYDHRTASSPHAPSPATAAWAGAVDLNPGFGFAPGSPQRVAAAAPGLAAVLARLEQLRGDVGRLELERMTHREVLQAGISRLNAELYRALAEARRQANGAL